MVVQAIGIWNTTGHHGGAGLGRWWVDLKISNGSLSQSQMCANGTGLVVRNMNASEYAVGPNTPGVYFRADPLQTYGDFRERVVINRVILHDYPFTRPTYAQQVKYVLAQEIGHALGMQHTPNWTSSAIMTSPMFPSIDGMPIICPTSWDFQSFANAQGGDPNQMAAEVPQLCTAP
jgi:hypothetical protein